MATAALYFPFIDVPNSLWFCQTLLYWDSIYSIMPLDFAERPERLQRFTRQLQQCELLEPIIPEAFVPELDSLADGFVEYIQELDPSDLRQRLRSKKMADVHTGKLPGSDFIAFLRSRRLAGRFDYPWLSIEARTANDYMAYLATCIAEVHENRDLRAVTNKIAYCSPLLTVRDKTDIQVQEIRQELLSEVFPVPKKALTPTEIQIFKKKFGSLLPEFRFWIEERVSNIADSTSAAIRQKRQDDTKQQIREQSEGIAKTLKKGGFTDFVFGDLFSVLGAIPLIKTLPNLVNKIYKVTQVAPKSGPMAYAAFAGRELHLK